MMMMEVQEEVVLCKDQLQIIKGRRTKRPRPFSPLTLATASSTTTSSSGEEGGGEGGRSSDDSKGFDRPVASPTTSVKLAESTEEEEEEEEEEEDMANCLMLLAQGQTRKPSEPASLATTSKTAPAGVYVHQCKTCNRCFPSFQALGGHRASHKRSKVNNEENNNNNNKGLMFVKEDDIDQFNNMNTTLSLQVTNNKAVLSNSRKSKVHECSICGAEFSSGQALGGHMRRHRSTFTNAATTAKTTTLSVGTRSSPESEDRSSKKPRTGLQLDLNLPAPEDHDHHSRESKFSFASEEKLLVFSTSSLVDCHY